MRDTKTYVQMVWGVALLLAGVGMFFSIPEKIPAVLEQHPHLANAKYFIYFCFYLIAVILAGGGLKKISVNIKSLLE